jgi:microcompartment protein CcmK/EutM
MILARVVGTVVATRKDERLDGHKLLVCRPVSPQGVTDGSYVVAVDMVGAGYQETVLVVSGSSARMAAPSKESPIDSAIVGIVDEVQVEADLDAPRSPQYAPKQHVSGSPAPQRPEPSRQTAVPLKNAKRMAAARGKRG